MAEKQYWASVPDDQIGSEIMGKVDSYKTYVENTLIKSLQKSYNYFFCETDIINISEAIKAIHVNHYGSLTRNIYSMVTSQRPAWDPRGENTDSVTQTNTKLARGLLDFYMRERRFEQIINKSTLQCLFLKEAWVSLKWNVHAGKLKGSDPETGLPIYEGDIECNTHTILDITRDVCRRDMKHQWYIVRTFENKWDLAAMMPEMADKITAIMPDNKFDTKFELNTRDMTNTKIGETDLIPVYTLYHDRCPALPSGRMVMCLAAYVCLDYGPLPFKRPYVFPITPGEQFESAFGHSNLMDLMPVQDAFNIAMSSILTNIAANGVQNFQCPKGGSPNIRKLKNGMNLLEYDPKAGKLEPIELLRTAPEVYKFVEMMQATQETLSNVSQIGRGNAPPTMSGTAMALLQQQSI
ncbi:MAG TPA: hypothetical protein PLO50_12995, partial [Nitrospira sp.]|nr:hypothetical protein [Nitrospira sp.]